MKIGKSIILLLILFLLLALLLYKQNNFFIKREKPVENISMMTPTLSSSPTETIAPVSPTPKPLTFQEMNSLYGPCTVGSVLMYHHIQTKESAEKEGNKALTVYTDVFRNQMQYLKDRGYVIISMADLASFFDQNISLPSKSALLTFDDAYDDFFTDAYPILREFGFKATVFVPTGLLENPGYLSWDQLSQMSAGNILFANHTWSHKNVKSDQEEMEKEISLAQDQLASRGFNNPKVFSFPYGISSDLAQSYLVNNRYLLAFTTKYGTILCKQLRFQLPRVRIGSTTLNRFGF